MKAMSKPTSVAVPKFGVKAPHISDDALLAELGYKQEFKREFTTIEVRFHSSVTDY